MLEFSALRYSALALSIHNFMQSRDFKFLLYPSDSQIYISSLTSKCMYSKPHFTFPFGGYLWDISNITCPKQNLNSPPPWNRSSFSLTDLPNQYNQKHRSHLPFVFLSLPNPNPTLSPAKSISMSRCLRLENISWIQLFLIISTILSFGSLPLPSSWFVFLY